MSEWSDLAPAPKAATATEPVRFSMMKMRGAPARGCVLIRKDVLASLDLTTHWRVKIRIGSGGRAHQIAIVPSADGPFELQEVGVAKGGGVWRVRLPHVDKWPDIAAMSEPRPFKVEREGSVKILVVDLPTFCWNSDAKAKALAAFKVSR